MTPWLWLAHRVIPPGSVLPSRLTLGDPIGLLYASPSPLLTPEQHEELTARRETQR